MEISTQLANTYGTAQETFPSGQTSPSATLSEEAASTNTVGDSVTLSPEAKELLETPQPKIDWETRTYKGKPIPDSYYKEKTPEMLSGKQPYIRWGGNSGVYYQAVDETHQEYEMRTTTEQLERKTQQISNYQTKLAEIEVRLQGEKPSSTLPIMQAWYQTHIERASQELSRVLEETKIGFGDLQISLDTAQEGILHYSEGKIDLLSLLQQYL